MYEITKQEFKDKMYALLKEESDSLIYSLDVLIPTLEREEYPKAKTYIDNPFGIMDYLISISNNIEILEKDDLIRDEQVYFINDQNLPARMFKTDYDLMIKEIKNDSSEGMFI